MNCICFSLCSSECANLSQSRILARESGVWPESQVIGQRGTRSDSMPATATAPNRTRTDSVQRLLIMSVHSFVTKPVIILWAIYKTLECSNSNRHNRPHFYMTGVLEIVVWHIQYCKKMVLEVKEKLNLLAQLSRLKCSLKTCNTLCFHMIKVIMKIIYFNSIVIRVTVRGSNLVTHL